MPGGSYPTFAIKRLTQWLKYAFPARHWTIDLDELPHAVQTDGAACGMFVLMTLRHLLLKKPLVERGNLYRERCRYFTELVEVHHQTVRHQTLDKTSPDPLNRALRGSWSTQLPRKLRSRRARRAPTRMTQTTTLAHPRTANRSRRVPPARRSPRQTAKALPRAAWTDIAATATGHPA
jgi:hypothetical protein